MSHSILLRPAVPGPRPLEAPCTGRSTIPTPARPARPPSPAVWVLCNMMFLCWLVYCFGYDRVSSRLLAVCFRLLLRYIVVVCSAAASQSQRPPSLPGRLACDLCGVRYALSVLVMVLCRIQSGRESVASRLFCFRLRLLCPPPILSHHITSCTQHTPHASHIHRLHPHATRTKRRAHHTHCTYHTLTIPGITPPTPRTFHTHHIHTTPHPLITHIHPQTPHTTRHSFLRICKSEMYALCSMPGMHSSARSSSTNISNAIHPSKVKLSYTKS